MTTALEDARLVMLGQLALVYLLAKFILKIGSVMWKRFLASPLDIKRKYGGKWALVTGSTDGIGKAYAFALAKCNMNIILVSRTQSKLDLTATEIQEKYQTGNKILYTVVCPSILKMVWTELDIFKYTAFHLCCS